MNHHFGEQGDIWKHLPLAEILRLNPPRHYWETHAGSASYPLTPSAARLHGVYHFLSEAPGDPDLRHSAYLHALQELPGLYPGSPLLALRALADRANYLFCDIDPNSAASLRSEVAHLHALVLEADGVAAVAEQARQSAADPASVFVLIDPFVPNERIHPAALTPLELAAALAARGFRVMFWYAYFSWSERGWARQAIAALAPGVPLWCGDAAMPLQYCYPDREGLFGCGIVLANATAAEIETCRRLGQALARIAAADQIPANNPPRLSFAVL